MLFPKCLPITLVCVAALNPFVTQSRLSSRLFATGTKSTSSPLLIKPLLLLDVDGVINGAGRNPWPDHKKVFVNGYQIMYSPTVVDKINSWSDSGLAEIRWLTSWNEMAQTMLAPALGIKHFENGRHVEDGQSSGKTKSVYMAINGNPDRPLVWIDDEVLSLVSSQRDDNTQLYFRVRPLSLFITPKLEEGLTLKDLNVIDTFLKNPTLSRADNLAGLK